MVLYSYYRITPDRYLSINFFFLTRSSVIKNYFFFFYDSASRGTPSNNVDFCKSLQAQELQAQRLMGKNYFLFFTPFANRNPQIIAIGNGVVETTRRRYACSFFRSLVARTCRAGKSDGRSQRWSFAATPRRPLAHCKHVNIITYYNNIRAHANVYAFRTSSAVGLLH